MFRLSTLKKFHVFIMNLCGVMPRRRYPPSLSRARQWRHVRFAFHEATILVPLMSSQITRSQTEETNAGVALTARRFILNI